MKENEITRELWQSSLPICFILSENDLNKIQHEQIPQPFYLLLARHLYLPCLIDKLFRYYSNYFSENSIDSNNLWFEYEHMPLKWHYPLGVLFDLHSSLNLPWQIIVHLNEFPEKDLIRFPDKQSIEAYFMSMLKEADALKHKGQIMGEMQQREHKQLWIALIQDQYEAFWNINRKLMSYTDHLSCFRYIPFRIYLFNRSFIQKLFSPYDNQRGKWLTLKELIEFALTDEIRCERSSTIDKKILSSNINDYRVIIHGVQPPLHTSVQWLSEYFSSPDNFLHICLIVKKNIG